MPSEESVTGLKNIGKEEQEASITTTEKEG